MTTYILLRNNKESAPCSLEELKQLGLKANDLVWVEGQSVCWLSPMQIPELKKLVGLLPAEAEIPLIEPLPTYEEKWAGYTQTGTGTEVPETKYSKPLDEIKETYLKNQEKKNRGFQVPPQFRTAIIYAGLVLLGVLAGVLIKKSGTKKDQVLSAAETRSIPNEIEASNTIVTDTGTVSVPPETTGLAEDDPTQQDPLAVITSEPQKTSLKNEHPLKQRPVVIETIPAPDTEQVTVMEEKKLEENSAKKISVSEVRSQVFVKTNDYSVGSFGGIKNLKLTVTNNSKYELDKVAVEIQYLKPLNELIRSETVSVQLLGPGETKVIDVKNSSRGVKVNCKITSIRSKEFSDDTAGL